MTQSNSAPRDRASAEIAAARLASPAEALLDFFEARCEILALRVRGGELAFIDAVDMAYSAAHWSGLVDSLGDDQIQAVMHAVFMNVSRRIVA